MKQPTNCNSNRFYRFLGIIVDYHMNGQFLAMIEYVSIHSAFHDKFSATAEKAFIGFGCRCPLFFISTRILTLKNMIEKKYVYASKNLFFFQILTFATDIYIFTD